MKIGDKCSMCGFEEKTSKTWPRIPAGKFAVIDGEGNILKDSSGRSKFYDVWLDASLEVDRFYGQGFLGIRRVKEGRKLISKQHKTYKKENKNGCD